MGFSVGRSTQTDGRMGQAGLMLLFSAEARRLLTGAKHKHGGGALAGRGNRGRERANAEARPAVGEGRGGWQEGGVIEPV